jgi:hypothetical protein
VINHKAKITNKIKIFFMQFEKIGEPKFTPLSRESQLLIKGGETSEGSNEQAGNPVWNDEGSCWMVPMRFWTADSLVNGVWCYENERRGVIYSPTLPPRPK